jgi:hypothetical protein
MFIEININEYLILIEINIFETIKIINELFKV